MGKLYCSFVWLVGALFSTLHLLVFVSRSLTATILCKIVLDTRTAPHQKRLRKWILSKSHLFPSKSPVRYRDRAQDEATTAQHGPPKAFASWVNRKETLAGDRLGLPLKCIWEAATANEACREEFESLRALINQLEKFCRRGHRPPTSQAQRKSSHQRDGIGKHVSSRSTI